MISPVEAEKLILQEIQALPSEDCPVADACGRVLRSAILADRDFPPYDRATMDGYALRSAVLAKGLRHFRIEGMQAAGTMPRTLSDREDASVEIMTGAAVPAGADCVVPYEHATREADRVQVDETAARMAGGNAIHRRGSDGGRGRLLVPVGAKLTPQAVAVAAACGNSRLTVALSPRIAVVATGDELVDVEMAVADHQIRRSNDYALRAALGSAGYARVDRHHLRDVPDEIEHRLWHFLAEYDVLVVCGGVSKGRFDHLPSVLGKLGVRRLVHGVAQRPGKPMWFGMSARRTPVFALPGNPVAAFVCLHRYVLPALERASGGATATPAPATLGSSIRGLPNLGQFIPVTLRAGPGAERVADPHLTNTSGDFVTLVGTDGFVELPPVAGDFPAGTLVPFRPWAGRGS